ncbi:cytochrome c [Enterobacterales bacterium BIT-L3]|uniref:Cytochrome c n=3 Tax=Enterobacteriaceae TaxID=543 RepID=A0A8K0V6V7_9ENTR|nr:cytochrome c [Tenebrionibacter intestinalis]MBV5096870.1 cytochrome c [Tenebrionicola larvae]
MPRSYLVGANITPDIATGIGKWRYSDFKRAMSEGIGHNGKRLYGAMPFTAYTKVTDEDNRAIWAYLQTLTPVRQWVETNQLPFPFNIRASLIVWNWLNADKGEYQPDLSKSAEWNRGAYIVQGLGHCGTCHTPKNILGGDKNERFLQGAEVENWWAPNITGANHDGLGRWSIQDIKDYLRDGINRYDSASGPMAEEVKNASQHWKDADLQAVAVYLKSLKDNEKQPPTALKPDNPQMVTGKAIYFDRCSACHTSTGKGEKNIFPQLANSAPINAQQPVSLMRVVLAGSRGADTPTHPTAPAMPSFAATMNDRQIADVLTYIRNSWGNAASAVSASDVQKMREKLKE